MAFHTESNGGGGGCIQSAFIVEVSIGFSGHPRVSPSSYSSDKGTPRDHLLTGKSTFTESQINKSESTGGKRLLSSFSVMGNCVVLLNIP